MLDDVALLVPVSCPVALYTIVERLPLAEVVKVLITGVNAKPTIKKMQMAITVFISITYFYSFMVYKIYGIAKHYAFQYHEYVFKSMQCDYRLPSRKGNDVSRRDNAFWRFICP